ncbi:ATP-grasp fold amidoligase family protein [Tenacibaculum caenipelagi]|uniref:Teichuronopeptide biosynthesis TupA-like protein n=1 Tax=Tenacibaculum caenipelagi TaxID=1325435 RepID=A0A4R6TBZ3_9FLAO|nr:ATP-grasp fold amidoligase family protein [Tenacibaculum caenipelagi]TDQ25503.1 teichuronopeptide biosynthesis TupA-like protein [Tenacibaculum caenipelagi]
MNKSVLRFLRKLTFLPQKTFLPFLYEYYTGKKLNLKNPQEFNEKIQWLKAFYQPKILNILVDKYAVREYVSEKIGEEYLNELYGVYDSFSEINFEELPEKFVLKAVHASSYNLICTDKSKLNLNKVKKKVKKWQTANQYYRTGQEWAYKDVKPRLIAEKYLKDEERDSLTDYKFYCFNGKTTFLEVHLDRADNHKRAFYDFDFKQLPFRYVSLEKSINEEIHKPATLEKMIELSEKLSVGFPFVRVDFYSVKNKIIFGEMTFYPSDGRKDFYPEEYNKKIGDMIKLPDLKGRKVITEIE